ncbi:hypothetical protein ABMX48_03695 [Streptomyces cavourensis]
MTQRGFPVARAPGGAAALPADAAAGPCCAGSVGGAWGGADGFPAEGSM